jgi:hypothetical protein
MGTVGSVEETTTIPSGALGERVVLGRKIVKNMKIESKGRNFIIHYNNKPAKINQTLLTIRKSKTSP